MLQFMSTPSSEKDRDVFASIIPEPVESDTVPNSSVPSSSDALHLPPEDVEEEQGISSNAGEGPSGIHHNYEDEASTFTKEQYEDELACHRAGTEEEEMGVDSLQRCLSQSEPPPTELGTPKRRKDGNWDIPDGILNRLGVRFGVVSECSQSHTAYSMLLFSFSHTLLPPSSSPFHHSKTMLPSCEPVSCLCVPSLPTVVCCCGGIAWKTTPLKSGWVPARSLSCVRACSMSSNPSWWPPN